MLCAVLVCVAVWSAGALGQDIPTHCQAELDAWCNNQAVPAIQGCYAALQKDDAKFPLYAR